MYILAVISKQFLKWYLKLIGIEIFYSNEQTKTGSKIVFITLP